MCSLKESNPFHCTTHGAGPSTTVPSGLRRLHEVRGQRGALVGDLDDRRGRGSRSHASVLQVDGPLVVGEPVGLVDALHALGVEQVVAPRGGTSPRPTASSRAPSSSCATATNRSATAVQAAKNSSVPASSPCAAASRMGRQARSTSSIEPAAVAAWRRRPGSTRSCRGSTRTSVSLVRGTGVRSASEIDLAPPWAVWPPSTGISAPVMNEAASLTAGRRRAAATSSGARCRPSGVSATLARGTPARRGRHRGLDVAGVDRVDADAARAELHGGGLGQAAQRPLAGGVGDRVVRRSARRRSRR